MRMLTDEFGESVNLEGRASGAVIGVVVDHDSGYLAFRLDGGPEGPRLEGFPVADGGGSLSVKSVMRPVVGFRWPEDIVTIRAGSERLRSGWPKQDASAVRERDARGLAAARALAQRLWGST